MSHHRPALPTVGIRDLEQLGQGINKRAAADTFAIYPAGPYGTRGRSDFIQELSARVPLPRGWIDRLAAADRQQSP
jgi:hypothetical protein